MAIIKYLNSEFDEEFYNRQEDPNDHPYEIDIKKLAVFADHLITSRRVRDQLLNVSGLFGEPAWDLLLLLFVAHVDGKQIPIMSASISSTTATSAELSYLKALESKKLVERVDSRSGDGVVIVQLTTHAVSQMTEALTRFTRMATSLSAANRFDPRNNG